MGNNTNRFTAEEDVFIRENYKTMKYKDIAKHLQRNEGSVATRIKCLELVKPQQKKEGRRIGTVLHPRIGVTIHIGTYGKETT